MSFTFPILLSRGGLTMYRVTSQGRAAGLLSTMTIEAASVAKYGNTAITCAHKYNAFHPRKDNNFAEIRKYQYNRDENGDGQKR